MTSERVRADLGLDHLQFVAGGPEHRIEDARAPHMIERRADDLDPFHRPPYRRKTSSPPSTLIGWPTL